MIPRVARFIHLVTKKKNGLHRILMNLVILFINNLVSQSVNYTTITIWTEENTFSIV